MTRRPTLRERFPNVDWDRPEPDWLSDPDAAAWHLVEAAQSWMDEERPIR